MSTTLPSAAPTPAPDGDPDEAPKRRRDTILRALALVICLGFVAMWAYVFANQDTYKPAGQLGDTRFPKAAEPICAATRDLIDELPPSREAETAAERADTIDEATDHLADMQQQLRAVVPTDLTATDAEGKTEADWINLWIDDWSIFIRDRYDYADELRRDETAEFLVSEKYGTQLSKSLDNFAQVNFMESCKVPGDV
jgi:hypothetical protein